MGPEGESSAFSIFPKSEVRPFTERGNQQGWEFGDCDKNKMLRTSKQSNYDPTL